MPSDTAHVGAPLRLYYNKLWGSLRVGASVSVKAGFNGWAEIVVSPMGCVFITLLGSRSLGCAHDPDEFMLINFKQLMEQRNSE